MVLVGGAGLVALLILTPVLPPLPLMVRVLNLLPVIGRTTCALSGAAKAKRMSQAFMPAGYHGFQGGCNADYASSSA